MAISPRLPIPGFPGYEIDEDGNTFSIERNVNRGKHQYAVKGRMLKPVEVRTYNCVYLYKNGVEHRKYVQTLMGMTHLQPPIEGKPELNHKNCNRKDNRKVNLEWNSRSENVTHSWGTCRKIPKEEE